MDHDLGQHDSSPHALSPIPDALLEKIWSSGFKRQWQDLFAWIWISDIPQRDISQEYRPYPTSFTTISLQRRLRRTLLLGHFRVGLHNGSRYEKLFSSFWTELLRWSRGRRSPTYPFTSLSRTSSRWWFRKCMRQSVKSVRLKSSKRCTLEKYMNEFVRNSFVLRHNEEITEVVLLVPQGLSNTGILQDRIHEGADRGRVRNTEAPDVSDIWWCFRREVVKSMLQLRGPCRRVSEHDVEAALESSTDSSLDPTWYCSLVVMILLTASYSTKLSSLDCLMHNILFSWGSGTQSKDSRSTTLVIEFMSSRCVVVFNDSHSWREEYSREIDVVVSLIRLLGVRFQNPFRDSLRRV